MTRFAAHDQQTLRMFASRVERIAARMRTVRTGPHFSDTLSFMSRTIDEAARLTVDMTDEVRFRLPDEAMYPQRRNAVQAFAEAAAGMTGFLQHLGRAYAEQAFLYRHAHAPTSELRDARTAAQAVADENCLLAVASCGDIATRLHVVARLLGQPDVHKAATEHAHARRDVGAFGPGVAPAPAHPAAGHIAGTRWAR